MCVCIWWQNLLRIRILLSLCNQHHTRGQACAKIISSQLLIDYSHLRSTWRWSRRAFRHWWNLEIKLIPSSRSLTWRSQGSQLSCSHRHLMNCDVTHWLCQSPPHSGKQVNRYAIQKFFKYQDTYGFTFHIHSNASAAICCLHLLWNVEFVILAAFLSFSINNNN